MSHIYIPPSPEQEVILRKQRRNSAATSIIVSFLIIILIGLIFVFILIPGFTKETTTMVAYSAPMKSEEKIQQQKKLNISKKPTAPSSSQARVIAANTTSVTAIPVPELDMDPVDISLDFGSGDDFGAGWEAGNESDAGGGATTFFKQEVVAQRVAYVIDASGSMNQDGRHKLMREELTKSVKQLKAPMKYQIIFFSAPAWVAGSEVKMRYDDGRATIKDDSGEYDWVGPAGKVKGWKQKGKKQVVPWLEYSAKTRRESIDHIEEQKLVIGTDWIPPLQMALEMEPPPQIIFFMTDGASGNSTKFLEDIRRLAKRNKTIINTIALMEPKAVDNLIYLAKETKGQFTIVDKNGKAEVQDIK
ncbi:hypothetical protein ACFQY0_02450 [Haloferula chungangensis]|uniref:VWFA domain-containing protein n=1 Tax=Haloferula chungangensis TaxID=1048331 RepID=A0ABW2L2S2_9BACT